MGSTCFLLSVLFLLSPFVRADFTHCKNIAIQWQPTSFRQGNLIVVKKPATQNQTGTFHLVCDNGHVEKSVLSDVYFKPNAGASVSFRMEQIDIYSENNNNCYLRYCLTTQSNMQCRNCNFTLPVIRPAAAANSSRNSLRLQWAPTSEKTGDLIISNFEISGDKQCRYDIFCDGFEVINYTFVIKPTFKLLTASATVSENSRMVEEYQCMVEFCIVTEEEQKLCEQTNYYHIIIPDVTNGRIIQRPDVFYYQWYNQNSAAQLQVADNQLKCDGVQFHLLMEHVNQGQLIVSYIPSITMVGGKGNVTVNCNITKTTISNVLIQPYVEVALIFPVKYFRDSFCSMDICLIANDSCTEVAKCGVQLHSSVHASVINNKYCSQLKFQWMPNGADHGSVLVTKELTMDHEGQFGNFSLTCENYEVVNGVVPTVRLYPLSAKHNETTVKFLLRRNDDVYTEQNNCTLQICITGLDFSRCILNIQCTVTLPPTNIAKPIIMQWFPFSNVKGSILMYNYEKKTTEAEYHYEVMCDGFAVTHTIIQASGYVTPEAFNVILALHKNVSMVEQFQCLVQMCSNTVYICTIYNMIIPDINAARRKIIWRRGLFYNDYLPSNTVELYNISDGLCDDMKLYAMKNYVQDYMTVRYTPLVMIRGKANFSLSCNNSTIITESEFTDVLIQPYVDITISFLADLPNDTLNEILNETCFVTICLNNASAGECSRQVHCDFQWFTPEPTAHPTAPPSDNEMTNGTDNNMPGKTKIESCEQNTWLWLVDSNEIGEAHFIVGNNIVNNAKYNGMTSLSCVNLTVVSSNPQPLQVALMDGGVVSFVVQSTTGSNERFQDCTFTACSDSGCELIENCFITIPLHQGGFKWSDQSNLLDTCPQSTWQWQEGLNGGNLSIKYKTKKKERGTIGIRCNGIEVNGTNEISNTDVATFTLVDNSTNPSQPANCVVHVCVRQYQFIGCKKSLNCILTIPSNNVSRVYRSYEEASEELLRNCGQENIDSDLAIPLCSVTMWDVFYTTGYAEGAVSLRVKLQGNDKSDEYLKVSIYCSGLDIKGSTEYKLVIPKTRAETVVEFNVSLPTSTNQESQILIHQCTIQTQRRPVFDSGMGNNIMCPSTTSCIIPVKTVFGRILPKCNVTKGKKSIHQLEVKSDQARVEITVSASPNNVYTVDPYCNKNNPFGHNTSEELLSNMFPSATEEGQFTIAISFYPECDNKTIASHFANKRLEECHIDIYWYCQGGEQLIATIRNLQFSDETMYCEPESIATALIVSMEKTFGVYSEAVAILLALLIGVGSLYALLIPAACIAVCCHYCRRSYAPIWYKFDDDSDGTDEELPTINVQSPIPAPPPPSALSLVSAPPQSSVSTSHCPRRRPPKPPSSPQSIPTLPCPPQRPSGQVPPPPPQSSVPILHHPPRRPPRPAPPPPESPRSPRRPSRPAPPPPTHSPVSTPPHQPLVSPQPQISSRLLPSPKQSSSVSASLPPPAFHAPPPPSLPAPPLPPPVTTPVIPKHEESVEAEGSFSPAVFIEQKPVNSLPTFHAPPPPPLPLVPVPPPPPPVATPVIPQHEESVEAEESFSSAVFIEQKLVNTPPTFHAPPPPLLLVPVPPPPPPVATPVIPQHEESVEAEGSFSSAVFIEQKLVNTPPTFHAPPPPPLLLVPVPPPPPPVANTVIPQHEEFVEAEGTFSPSVYIEQNPVNAPLSHQQSPSSKPLPPSVPKEPAIQKSVPSPLAIEHLTALFIPPPPIPSPPGSQ